MQKSILKSTEGPDVQIDRISKKQSEINRLKVFCQDWEYWSYDELFQALDDSSYQLYGLTLGSHTNKLRGAILYKCAAGCADLIYVYIDKNERNQGFGSLIIRDSLKKLVKAGVKEVFLEVRASNLAALHVYQHLGFVQTGLRKAYYQNPCEDAVTFKMTLKD